MLTHFISMIVINLLGFFVDYKIVYLETISGEFSLKAKLIFSANALLYVAAFVLFWNKKNTDTRVVNSINSNGIYYVYMLSLVFYWLPVFIFCGVSDVDRLMWRIDNEAFFLDHTVNYVAPLALATVIEQWKHEKRKLIVVISYIIIMILVGERFTGIVIGAPIIMSLKVFGERPVCILLLAFAAACFKLATYFNVGIDSVGMNLYGNPEIASRIANESGLINAIINLDISWMILDYPTAVIPYGEWGTYDKTLMMSILLKDSIYQIARGMGGLVTGTYIDSISFYFNWMVALPVSILLAYIGAQLLFYSILFIKGAGGSKIIGISFLFAFYLRYYPIIVTGSISSLFKFDFVVLLLLMFLAKYRFKMVRTPVAT